MFLRGLESEITRKDINILYIVNKYRKIWTVILDDPTVVSEHSIIDAATLCGTSKFAMLRFAKKLGYSGYSEFKYAVGESFIKEEKKYGKWRYLSGNCLVL